jgi:hypothetical protein
VAASVLSPRFFPFFEAPGRRGPRKNGALEQVGSLAAFRETGTLPETTMPQWDLGEGAGAVLSNGSIPSQSRARRVRPGIWYDEAQSFGGGY